jgi:hypothetical protein
LTEDEGILTLPRPLFSVTRHLQGQVTIRPHSIIAQQ